MNFVATLVKPVFLNSISAIMGDPRPVIVKGQYILTKPRASWITCDAYESPPVGHGARFITTIAPDTYIGPVSAVLQSDRVVCVFCEGYFMNIWEAARGTTDYGKSYAFVISQNESDLWCLNGWRHEA